MAFLEGNRLLFELSFPIHDMCVDPYGYYGWGVYEQDGTVPAEFGDARVLDDPENPTVGATYASSPLPEICNSAPVAPIPQLAWTGRVARDVAMGFGMLAPVVVPGQIYGGEDGTIETPYGPRPTPTRYSLVKQEVPFALAPAIGIAYRALPQLALGLTAQIFMAKVRGIAVQNAASGTQPSSDWLARVEASDYFVPVVTVSVHAKPVASLDAVAALRIADEFNGSGRVTYETNTFHRGAPVGPVPYENEPFTLSSVSSGLPWQANLAVRYGWPLPGGGTGIGDPMDTELWDAEVDVGASFNGATDGTVQVGEEVVVETRQIGGPNGELIVSDLPSVDLDRHLQTSYTVRVGGSYSVVPREVAVHAGGFYESRGVQPEYLDIDTFAMARVGLGLGVVLRLGSVDLRAGYSHIFSETLEIAPPPHQPFEEATDADPTSGFDQRVGGTIGAEGTLQGGVVLSDPDAPRPGNADAVARKTQTPAVATSARPARVINAGRYSAAFDVISVGILTRF
jgi:hypothetical protein